jgi:cold shock CspA family protein
MQVGHIKWVDPRHFHGLIATPNGPDVFFRFTDGIPPFVLGDAVSFDVREDGRVKQAVSVIKVPDSIIPAKLKNRRENQDG